MKKTVPLTLCLLIVFQILIVRSSFSTTPTEMEDKMSILSASLNATMKMPSTSIERLVDFISGGYLRIKDTFILSSNASSKYSISNYVIGLPRNCSDNLIYYSASYHEKNLKITPIKNLDERFLWLNISFSEAIEIGGDEIYNFTVTYIFFNLIMEKNENIFHASFPLYPALMKNAEYCNVTVKLPAEAVSYSENLLNKAGDQTVFYNLTSPLPAYSNIFSWIEFETANFKLFELKELKREISINPLGKIFVTDFYKITRLKNVNTVTFILPQGASDISVYDAYDMYKGNEITIISENEHTEVSVYLRDRLKADKKAKIAISYILPFWKYVMKNDWQNYVLQMNVTKPDDGVIDDPETWIIGKIEVSVVLPEGATPQGSLKQEWENVTKIQELKFFLKYSYAFIWIAFRPTLWTGLIMGLAILIFFFAKIFRKTEKSSAITVSTKTLRKFVETFEERLQIMSEIDFLEQLSRNGKISRRHYRLQRKALEDRLSTIRGNLSSLMSEIKSFGARYERIMEHIENAVHTIENMNRKIREVEARYQQGEISTAARKKLLSEYMREKEDAEKIIYEIFLRIKEDLT